MQPGNGTPRADAIAELLRKLADFTVANAGLIERVLRSDPSGTQHVEVDPTPGGIMPVPASPPEDAPAEATAISIAEPKGIGTEPAPTAPEIPASPAEPPPTPLDPKQAVSMISLGGAPTSRGSLATVIKPVAASPHVAEVTRCRDLIRAHERAVRSLRRLVARPADPDALRSLEDRLRQIAEHRVETWIADPWLRRSLAADELRRIERRYRALNASLGWTLDFFRDRPNLPARLGDGTDRQELQARLALVAEAQCGTRNEFTALADDHPGLHECEAQKRVFLWLREAIREDRFALHLKFLSLKDRSSLARSGEILEEIERLRLRQDRVDEIEAWKGAITVDELPETGSGAESGGFDSVSEAIDAAQRNFGGTGSSLVFLDRAIESAEASTFRRPDQVYRALEALYRVATEWSLAPNGMGTSFRERMVAAGFDEKPCSDHTMSRYRKHYTAQYERRTIPLSLHVTLGSRNANTCMSIHWHRDELSRKVVVGHCGRHLPNTLS